MGYNTGGVDKVGFVLIALGMAVVVGYAAIAFFTALSVPLWLRIAISAIVMGLLLVLASALWERRKVSAEESFREVKR